MERILDFFKESGLWYWLLSILGGNVDYINQLARKERVFNVLGWLVHLTSAAFFGAMAGMIAYGLGYHGAIVGAAAGLGGFMGVRVSDMVTYKMIGIDRRS